MTTEQVVPNLLCISGSEQNVQGKGRVPLRAMYFYMHISGLQLLQAAGGSPQPLESPEAHV